MRGNAHRSGHGIRFAAQDRSAHGGDPVGRHAHIVVGEEHDIAPGSRQPGVEPLGFSTPRLVQITHLDSGNFAIGTDARCCVAGTVVDDKQFHFKTGRYLEPCHAFERFAQALGTVFRADQDGNRRCHFKKQARVVLPGAGWPPPVPIGNRQIRDHMRCRLRRRAAGRGAGERCASSPRLPIRPPCRCPPRK